MKKKAKFIIFTFYKIYFISEDEIGFYDNNLTYHYFMKNFIIYFFRGSPACTGFISLMITLHLVGVKDLRTPLSALSNNVWLFFVLYCFIMMLWMLLAIPHIAQEKRERRTWAVVGTSVLILTIIAKITLS